MCIIIVIVLLIQSVLLVCVRKRGGERVCVWEGCGLSYTFTNTVCSFSNIESSKFSQIVFLSWHRCELKVADSARFQGLNRLKKYQDTDGSYGRQRLKAV